jgi:xanthine dehydrogenase molybdopterin-binding subunit B
MIICSTAAAHALRALAAPPCAHSSNRHLTSRRQMPGVVRIVTGADVPVNLNTLLSLARFRPG